MSIERAALRRLGRRGSIRTRDDRGATSTRVLAAGLVAVGSLTVLAVAGSPPASASTLDGIASIANPTTLGVVTSGASTTQFTVTLPSQAACAGDTASDGYHVYSYLVPKGTNLSALTFQSFPSSGYGLVDDIGTYYGPVNTAIGTGQIVSVPGDFEWGPLVSNDGIPLSTLLYTGAGTTASGVWEAGLACANTHGVLTDNWNTEVTFSASNSDPNGFTWSAVPGPSGSSPAAFTSADSTTFFTGSAGTFTATTSGSPTPAITESGTLPAGVTFSDGVLSGTPTAIGSYPITLTATNGIEAPVTQNFSLTVAGFEVTTTSLPPASVGAAYSQQLTTGGAPSGATVTWKKVSLPKGFALSSSGLLTGTPSSKAVGAQSVKVSVTDAKGGTPATATIPLAVDEAPAFDKTSPTAAGVTEGEPASIALTATGFPAPTFSLTGSLPAGLSFDGTTGVLSGTPTVTANSSQDTLTIQASNGVGAAATETFTLAVYAPLVVATTPLTIAQGATVPSGFQLATITGTEVGGTLKVKATGLPKGLTLSDTGVLSGTVSAATAAKAYAVTIAVSSKDAKTAVTATGTATITVTS